MPHVLALDFDGVLCDSLLESYLITWRLAGGFDPGLAPDEGPLPTMENIHDFRRQNLEHWSSFEALVPFCNRAEDYLLAHRAVCEKRGIETREQFIDFAGNQSRDELDRFHEAFYAERYRLAGQDRKRWLSLNSAYPSVAGTLSVLAEKFTLAVATSKDRESVRLLLQSWGLDGLFQPQAVLDKSAGASKRAHLNVLREMYGCSFGRITFIDDKVAHLIDCLQLGIRAYLAAWGYNGAAEHEQARRHSIPILELDDFSSISPA